MTSGHAGTRSAPATMLQRVRALLAKAESTTFPEEAESLTAKAQELMARYAIDEALLAASHGSSNRTHIGGERIVVDDPYASAKSLLLSRVAHANRCRAVWSRDDGVSTVFGTASDVEMVEMLFTSLLVQATDTLLREGRRVDQAGRSRTRSFRHSFLLAYAIRIGERLAETTAAVVADEVERNGAQLLPVLANRALAVEEAVREAFPRLVRRRSSGSNYAGWAAGRTAADLASLAFGQELAAG